MGYYAHDTVIAETWNEEQRERIVAFRESLPEAWRALLVSTPAVVNGSTFWAFMPDGSKEWWDTSNEGDDHRVEFGALLDEMGLDHVAVRWGGDYGRESGATVRQGLAR